MELWRPPATATTIMFPIVDADGDVVTGAASLDSEWLAFADNVEPTDGAFADCTNEANEIGASGVYALTLTASELPAASPYVYVQIKTGTAGAKTQHILITTATPYVDLQRWRGTQPLLLSSQRVDVTVGNMQTDVVTAGAIAANAVDASALAADAVNEIVDQVWDEAWGDHVAANSEGQIMQRLQYATSYLDAAVSTRLAPTTAGRTLDVDAAGGAEVGSFQTGAITAGAFAAGAIDASAIAADAIGASELALDAASEFADALLGRNIMGGSSTGRQVRDAFALLRNRVAISGATFTVYDTDDTTAFWTATIATTEASSIVDLNP